MQTHKVENEWNISKTPHYDLYKLKYIITHCKKAHYLKALSSIMKDV